MRRTFRAFALIYLILVAIALGDYFISLPIGETFVATELLKVLGGSSVAAMTVASLTLLAGDAYWLICMPLIVWLLIKTGVTAFLQYHCWNQGLTGEAFVVSVITLSWEKVLQFISTHVCAVILGVGFLCAILGLVMLMVSVRIDRMSVKSFLFGATLFLACGFSVFHLYPWDRLSSALFDRRLSDAFVGVSVYCELLDAGRPVRQGAWRSSETNLLAVVMIGESSSRLHWSLYGYERRTTPRLDGMAAELMVFSNLTATAGFTPYALRDVFTMRENDVRASFPSLALAAGYDCRFVSSQEKWGFFCGSDELLFGTCRDRLYLPKDESDVHYDSELVPHILAESMAEPTNRIVFAHMVGSHVPFCVRCPEDRRIYDPDLCDSVVEGLSAGRRSEVNHYDNSIALTDSVLAELIEGLRKVKRPALLIYLSDHGESPRTFGRDLNSPETFAVPFFIWASPSCEASTCARLARIRTLTGKALRSTDCNAILCETMGLVRNEAVQIR